MAICRLTVDLSSMGLAHLGAFHAPRSHGYFDGDGLGGHVLVLWFVVGLAAMGTAGLAEGKRRKAAAQAQGAGSSRHRAGTENRTGTEDRGAAERRAQAEAKEELEEELEESVGV
ncbi:hypothetical protein [Streptomyces atratus]|uniref:hypothetical protein n=1 Tax=Streptomyces atratus TaxID=1893 RepID=UPI0034031A5E